MLKKKGLYLIFLLFTSKLFSAEFNEKFDDHKCPDTNYNYGIYKSTSNNYWWTYTDARNADFTNLIQGKSLILNGVIGSIKSSPIYGGISSLTFQMNRGTPLFDTRTFMVEIYSYNSDSATTFKFSKSGFEKDTETFEITDINIGGSFTLKIQNTTPGAAIVIDNITWVSNDMVAQQWTPAIWEDYEKDSVNSILYNYKFAGYKSGEEAIPDVEVKTSITNYGAIANDDIDDTQALQDAIDYASSVGGGAVEVPAGKFLFGNGTQSKYITMPSNVVIRGSGSTEQGTVFFITDLICSESTCPYSHAVFTTINEGFAKSGRKITATASKGTNILKLETTLGFKAGDAGRIRMYNPNNGIRTNDLSLLLTAPLSPEPEWTNYTKYAPFECAFIIEEVIDGITIKLKQPLMEEISVNWNPKSKFELLIFVEGVGIENLRIESAFPGGYSHHKNWEVDYGWSAINFSNAKDCWIRDLVINDMTMDIGLENSMNITVENIIIDGKDGHHGIKVKNSWFNLVQNCYFKTFRTHPIGGSGMAHANVFTNITIDHPNGMIDFHGGGFPSHNLFERINNSNVDGGGAIQNMPHAGQYNTFWNITGNVSTGGKKPWPDFFSGFWNYPSLNRDRFGGKPQHDCYKLYPKSIMVGVYHPGYLLEVEHSTEDRDDDWIYNEGFNRPNVFPPSLYEAQKNLIGTDTVTVVKYNELYNRTDPVLVYQMYDNLYLNLDVGKGTIVIYDITGRRIGQYTGSLSKNDVIPIQLIQGFYVVSIIKNGGIKGQKIIFR